MLLLVPRDHTVRTTATFGTSEFVVKISIMRMKSDIYKLTLERMVQNKS